jgi:tetratricopeptide (TPR) repeat protein
LFTNLGNYHHKITTKSSKAQKYFDQGLRLIYAFNHDEAGRAFHEAARLDPNCAMAYWGIALTHWGNPFAGLRMPQAIAAGKAAIDKGQSTGSPTPREKGYIDAVAGLFSSADPGTQRARVLAYEKATEALAAANPTDTEARIFWALAIDQTALPTDKTFAQNLRAAEILEPLYKKMPNHPGLAHYIIHAVDSPPLAELGLAAARAYAGIAPDAPHALHMPSHIFTRLGQWDDSIVSNTASTKSAIAQAQRLHGGGGAFDQLHALDYLVYAVAVQESGENPPPDFKKLQFPITDSPALFEKSKWRIESLSPKIQDVIESLQPYKRPHPTVPPLLAILRDFNDSDKHRLLHVLINATPQGQFRNIGHVPEGVNISVEIYQPSSGIEDKAEIAAIIFSEPTPDVNYQLMADFVIAMSHAPNPGTGVPWSDIGSIVIRLTITEHLS